MEPRSPEGPRPFFCSGLNIYTSTSGAKSLSGAYKNWPTWSTQLPSGEGPNIKFTGVQSLYPNTRPRGCISWTLGLLSGVPTGHGADGGFCLFYAHRPLWILQPWRSDSGSWVDLQVTLLSVQLQICSEGAQAFPCLVAPCSDQW